MEHFVTQFTIGEEGSRDRTFLQRQETLRAVREWHIGDLLWPASKKKERKTIHLHKKGKKRADQALWKRRMDYGPQCWPDSSSSTLNIWYQWPGLPSKVIAVEGAPGEVTISSLSVPTREVFGPAFIKRIPAGCSEEHIRRSTVVFGRGVEIATSRFLPLDHLLR